MRYRLRTLSLVASVVLCAITGLIVGDVLASGVFNYKPTIGQRIVMAGTFGVIGAVVGLLIELIQRRSSNT